MSRFEISPMSDLLTQPINRRKALQIAAGLATTSVLGSQPSQASEQPLVAQVTAENAEIAHTPYKNDAFIADTKEIIVNHPDGFSDDVLETCEFTGTQRKVTLQIHPNNVGQREAKYVLTENGEQLVSILVNPNYTLTNQLKAIKTVGELPLSGIAQLSMWTLFNPENNLSNRFIDVKLVMDQLKKIEQGNFDEGFDNLLGIHQPYEISDLAVDWYNLDQAMFSPNQDPELLSQMQDKYKKSRERITKGDMRFSEVVTTNAEVQTAPSSHLRIGDSVSRRASLRNIVFQTGKLLVQGTELARLVRSKTESSIRLDYNESMELLSTEHPKEDMQLPEVTESVVLDSDSS